MGLSASQGRLLLLTARISDIELSETLIAQQQQQLAQDRENIAKEYNDAMSNYKITIKMPDESETGKFTRSSLNYNNLTQQGYLAHNDKMQIYLKPDPNEEGKFIVPADIDGQPLLSISYDENGKATATIAGQDYDVIDGSKLYENETTLQNSIINGAVKILKTDLSDPQVGISMVNLNSETKMEYVLDTSDDAAAESKYEYETARLARQDNQLDLEMQQLETQHNAVIKEYDSVKQVISSNVDRTFNLFSNG